VSPRAGPGKNSRDDLHEEAAAELKSRIQRRLLENEGLQPQERLDKAERLERAVIGTVHSVAHQLLTRYAVQLGLSPTLDVLDDAPKRRHTALSARKHRPGAVGTGDGARAKLSFTQPPQETALVLIGAMRSNRIAEEAFRAQLQASGRRLSEVMRRMTSPGSAGLSGCVRPCFAVPGGHRCHP